MSNITKEQMDSMEQQVAEQAELENLKAETAKKKAILDNKRINAQFDELQTNEKDLDLAKKIDYGAMSQEQIRKIVEDNDEYMKAAKSSMYFICDSFTDVVPFFRKNLILIGGKTGEGKSTTVANIVYNVIRKADPSTGKVRRCLVITNEERAEDFYNRITSLINGWHYTNHSKFTEKQLETFRKMIPVLASSGRLIVVDNNHGGSHGVTTSIEGIQTIFESLIANKEYYDCIVIDYYQNIMHSKNNPRLEDHEVQARLADLLDRYKNIYPAPIVLMAQIEQSDKEEKPFQKRIKGRKVILDKSTHAMEMIADRKNLRTKWVIHKSRFNESIGQEMFTGYDHGRFIEYTDEFAAKVININYERDARKLNGVIDAQNGISNEQLEEAKKDKKNKKDK